MEPSDLLPAYGFFVTFDRGTITLTEARDLVDRFRDGVPVILHEREVNGRPYR